MASPLFGKEWYEKSQEHHQDAVNQFNAAVAAARASSDEAVKQNMVFLSKSAFGPQEVLLSLHKLIKKDESPTKEEMTRWYELLKSSTRAVGERMFVVMTAQSKGWAFARELDFYQSGEEADSNYQKVAKNVAKRELKEKEERKPKRPRSFGFNRQQHHGSFGSYAPQYAMAPPMWPMPLPAAATASAAPRVNRKEHMRCNNCAEFGHFARECPKPPLPSGSK